jgi:hypothetical protein
MEKRIMASLWTTEADCHSRVLVCDICPLIQEDLHCFYAGAPGGVAQCRQSILAYIPQHGLQSAVRVFVCMPTHLGLCSFYGFRLVLVGALLLKCGARKCRPSCRYLFVLQSLRTFAFVSLRIVFTMWELLWRAASWRGVLPANHNVRASLRTLVLTHRSWGRLTNCATPWGVAALRGAALHPANEPVPIDPRSSCPLACIKHHQGVTESNLCSSVQDDKVPKWRPQTMAVIKNKGKSAQEHRLSDNHLSDSEQDNFWSALNMVFNGWPNKYMHCNLSLLWPAAQTHSFVFQHNSEVYTFISAAVDLFVWFICWDL